jgi:preprotein translocase subunit SecA
VVEIPTNEPVVRDDKNDFIFKNKESKFAAVAKDIKGRYEHGQPVLVGTIAVETSEYLSELLERAGVPHNVLNAKQHEREAEIIKGAGQPHAVTIATNMAGRGVDIQLGPGVTELGGLYVIGTERHEARRIDNQLRGRSGRQGDPGETLFYLSGEDDLVRLFAGDRIKRVMEISRVPDGEPIQHRILSRQIEGAQKKVEEMNFVSRKQVLKYDEVMNMQRRVIYEQRRRVLDGEDLSEEIKGWIADAIGQAVDNFTASEFAEEWDLAGLCNSMQALYGSTITAEELKEDEVPFERVALGEEFAADALEEYKAKEDEFEQLQPDLMRDLERFILLQVVDNRWREHLDNMDYLREGVHLRAMAQKDPLVEYTAEGHEMFEEIGGGIREEVVFTLFHVQIEPQEAQAFVEQPAPSADTTPGMGLSYEHDSVAGADAIAAAGETAGAETATAPRPRQASAQQRVVSEREKLGRNDPCWCGSGKKYKRCHGA